MTATLDTLRIGEVIDVEVIITAEDPEANVNYSNQDFTITAGGKVVINSELGNHAEVEAVSPGTETLTFEADDRFSDTQSSQRVLTVIDATSMKFRFDGTLISGTLVFLDEGDYQVSATAIPQDIRGDDPPVYSVTDILWTSANGKVQFDTGGGPGSTGSGTLTLTLVAVETGDDTVTVSFKNSLLATITGTIPVKIYGATSFEFTIDA